MWVNTKNSARILNFSFGFWECFSGERRNSWIRQIGALLSEAAAAEPQSPRNWWWKAAECLDSDEKGLRSFDTKTSNFFLASLWLFPLDLNIFLFALLCVVVVGWVSWGAENSCEVVVECRFVLIACAWAIYSRPQDTITTAQQPKDEDKVFPKIFSAICVVVSFLVMMRATQCYSGAAAVRIFMAELRFILIALITFTVESSTNELNGTWVEKYFRMENVKCFQSLRSALVSGRIFSLWWEAVELFQRENSTKHRKMKSKYLNNILPHLGHD